MEILFQGSVAKHPDRPEDNEDAMSVVAERDRIVVCDGASESYDGKNWARLLAEKFDDEPLSEETLAACLEAFLALHDPTTMSWSKAAAFERGSFSTALIAQNESLSSAVTIQCIGDSCAVLTDGVKTLHTLPYQHSTEFEGKPTLLSTVPHHNAHLYPAGSFEIPKTVWHYEADNHPFLLCMTDALGAWLLRRLEEDDGYALPRLLAIRTEDELRELVELERTEGRMRHDDSTLAIVAL